MCKIISVGELAVGQFVTILSNEPTQSQSIDEVFGKVLTATHVDRSGCGDVFQIQAIDLPYIVMNQPDSTVDHERQNRSYDTRRVSLMEVSEAYRNALKRNNK